MDLGERCSEGSDDVTCVAGTSGSEYRCVDTSRVRFVEAMRELVVSAASDGAEKMDGSSDGSDNSGWRTSLNPSNRGSETCDVTTADEYVKNTGIEKLVEWMLLKVDEQTEKTRRELIEQRKSCEKNLANVRASHATRLRALDAQHKAAVDAWKKSELKRARDAAIDVVQQTRESSEQQMNQVKLELQNSRLELKSEKSEALAWEAKAKENLLELEQVMRKTEEGNSQANTARANIKSTQIQKTKEKDAFHTWRVATLKSIQKKTKTLHFIETQKKNQATLLATKANGSTEAALALSKIKTKLTLLSSTGRFTFKAWRTVTKDNIKKRLDKKDKAVEDKQKAKEFIADLYLKKFVHDKVLWKVLEQWREVAVGSIEKREALEILERKAMESQKQWDIKALASAFLWRRKLMKKKIVEKWLEVAKVNLVLDEQLTRRLMSTFNGIKVKTAVTFWKAFISLKRKRVQSILHTALVVNKTRNALKRWRTISKNNQKRKQKILHSVRLLFFVRAAKSRRRLNIHQRFREWRGLSQAIRETRCTAVTRLRVLRPAMKCFSIWANSLRATNRRQIASTNFAKKRTLRKTLLKWWVATAEAAEKGGVIDPGKTYPENIHTGPNPLLQRTVHSLQWETPRGRPLQHWLGKALTAAARLGNNNNNNTPLRSTLVKRVLVCGSRLNVERDTRRALLDIFRGDLDGTNGVGLCSRPESHTRPTFTWTRAKGVEEEALRVLRDVLEALGDKTAENGRVCDTKRTSAPRAARQRNDVLPRIPRRHRDR